MDIDQLKFFQKLAETEHMSNTAAEFHLSQSTLSNCIQRMEVDLGCRLFTRKGRRIVLNEAGRTFLPYANRMLQQYNEAQVALNEIAQKEKRLVRICVPPYTSFPDLFTGLNSKYPNILIENDAYSPNEMKRCLLTGQLDFCITGLHIEDEKIECTVLSVDELVIVMSKNHILSDLGTVPLRTFASEHFCDHAKHDPSGSNLQYYSHIAGFDPQIDFYVHAIGDIFPVITTTNVLALIPMCTYNIYAHNGLPITAVHISEPSCYSHLYLYRKHAERERAVVRNVREFFIDYFNAKQT